MSGCDEIPVPTGAAVVTESGDKVKDWSTDFGATFATVAGGRSLAKMCQ